MQNGFYQAVGGMVTQLNRLDVISNNLANVNTAGFKQKDVIISDFERIFQTTQDELPIPNHTKKGASYLNRQINKIPQISEHYTDFSVGAIKYTGNKLDLALENSNLFFAVCGKDGNIKFTQNGSFSINDDGFLVNKDGDRILSSNYFNNPENDGILLSESPNIIINENGEVHIDGEYQNSILIAMPEDVREMQKIGDNLYKINDIKKIQQISNSGKVIQGALMSSNVNPINQMTSLINTHRLVEMYQKVISTHMDDLNSDAINKIASTK